MRATRATGKESGRSYDTGDAAIAFFELKDRKSRSRPMYLGCLSLRLAVVKDAHRIIALGPTQSPGSISRYNEARDWARGGTESSPGFSLPEICEVFGWQIDAMRRKLLTASQRPATATN